jgi:ligand-binding sensor domain-containing protein/signal transduction histidine kinase
VNCILQDRRGFLWFCTTDGFNRYDGRQMRVFKHVRGDPASLSNNFVRHAIEDEDGALWLATKLGLNRFDPVTERFRSFRHDPADSTSLSSDNVMRVLRTGDGRIWAGTWGGGLNELDPASGTARRFDLFVGDEELPRGNVVNALFESGDGTLWVATITGLFSRSPDERRFTRHALADPGYDGPRDSIVICIHEDEEGVLWLGTYTGLLRYDPRDGSRRRFPLVPEDPKSIAANQIRDIIAALDGGDDLWMTTAARGLVIFDRVTGSMEFLRHDLRDPESIGHDALWSMFADRGGTLWVGTDGRGVDKLTPMATRFPHVADLPGSRSVWSFGEDPSGALWVGTGDGLIRQDPETGSWSAIRHRPGDPTSIGEGVVNAMILDRTGTMWFATASAGLSRLADPAPSPGERFRFETFRHDPADPASIGADRLLSLLEDREGRIWVGTVDDGVDVFDPATGVFSHHRPDRDDPNSISDTGVECIYEDRSGVFWLGTLTGGLNRLDAPGEPFVRYAQDAGGAGLSNNHVTCVLEDGAGNLWIGTAGGLNRLDPGRTGFTSYFEADGLPNDYIYGLLEDDDGRIWMGTNQGLARLDPATETFRRFTVRDGLQSNEFNAGAFFQSPRGELFFGGHNGFNRFFPGRIRHNPAAPPVVLTSFEVLGRPADLGRAVDHVASVTLSHRDYFCSFEFAALDFWAPEQNRFQYRMDDLDAGWIDAGTRNFASYTNLAPGRYVFRVRGANADGVWNETGTSLAIVVTPPFWRRSWFFALAASAMAAGAFGLHRYRLNRLLEIERLRTRISSDLHDEIANNLSSIAMFSGMIQEEGGVAGRTSHLLERLRLLAEESVGSIRDIIWAINPTAETLHDLLIRLQDNIVPVCRGKKIQTRFDFPPESSLPGRNLAPEVRQHLWLLLKEALNNAVRHSGGSRLAVSAVYEGGMLRVRVTDDGEGFDPGGSHEGNGLRTMAMRARQLRGRLRVDSKRGRGTVVQVEVPL